MAKPEATAFLTRCRAPWLSALSEAARAARHLAVGAGPAGADRPDAPARGGRRGEGRWPANRSPLTIRAAALLARGRLIKEVAEEVGVSPRTVARWSTIPDFKDQVRRQREVLFPADGVPTAEGALLDALTATKPSGEPDHAIRIASAKAILGTPVTSPDAQDEPRKAERIYVAPDDGAPRRHYHPAL